MPVRRSVWPTSTLNNQQGLKARTNFAMPHIAIVEEINETNQKQSATAQIPQISEEKTQTRRIQKITEEKTERTAKVQGPSYFRTY